MALRRNYPGLSGAPLLNKVSQDVAFLNEPLARTLAEMPKGKTLGPGRGRVYVWVSHEAVAILTRGLISAAPSSNEVFPSKPTPGFAEWRRDFEALRGTLTVGEWFRSELLDEFVQSLSALPEWQSTQIRTRVTAAVELLGRQRRLIDVRLNEIDELELTSSRYRVSDALTGQFIGWLSAAFVLGVLVPLSTILLRRWQTRTMAGFVGVAALVPLGVAVWIFVRSVPDVPTTIEADYLESRWYEPLHRRLSEDGQRLAAAGPLDRRAFLEAESAAAADHFSQDVQAALAEYIKATDGYNRIALELATRILDRVRADRTYSSLPSPPASEPGQVSSGHSLPIVKILDATYVRQTFTNVAQRPPDSFSLMTHGTTATTREHAPVSGRAVVARRLEIERLFGAIRADVCASPSVLAFDSARRAADDARLKLAATLRANEPVKREDFGAACVLQ